MKTGDKIAMLRGWRNLAAAILEVAVLDLRACVEAGMIKEGAVVDGGPFSVEAPSGVMFKADAADLCRFIHGDGFAEVAKMANLNIDLEGSKRALLALGAAQNEDEEVEA